MTTPSFHLSNRLLRIGQLSIVAIGVAVAGCDSLGVGGQDPLATGTWVGTYSLELAPELAVPLSLRITEQEGGVLQGEGEFTGSSGQEIPVRLSGTHVFPVITGSLILGDDRMDLAATLDSDGERMTGSLTEGQTTAVISLARQ